MGLLLALAVVFLAILVFLAWTVSHGGYRSVHGIGANLAVGLSHAGRIDAIRIANDQKITTVG